MTQTCMISTLIYSIGYVRMLYGIKYMVLPQLLLRRIANDPPVGLVVRDRSLVVDEKGLRAAELYS